MQEFIDSVSSRLGISSDQAKSAAGAFLNMVREHVDPAVFQQLSDKLPGSADLADAAAAEEKPAGGLGGLLGTIAEKVGLTGPLGGLIHSFSQSGMDIDQAKGFVSTALEYIQKYGGSDLLDKILDKIPGLSALIPAATTQT